MGIEVNVLGQTDYRKGAWLTSRPYLKYEDVNMEELETVDFSLQRLKVVYMKLTTSIAVREIFSDAKVSLWAQTSRVNPLEDMTLAPDVFINNGEVFNRLEDEFKELQSSYSKDTQDRDRMGIPTCALTTYTVGVEWNVLMGILHWMFNNKPVYFNVYGKEIIYQLKEHFIVEDAGVPFDKFKYTLPDIMDRPEWVEESYETLTHIIMTTQIPLNLKHQLVRHSYLTIMDDTSFMQPSESELLKLGDLVWVTIVAKKSDWEKVMSTRSCWIADSKLYENLLAVYYKDDDNDHKFRKSLPCKCNKSKCPYAPDVEGRVTGMDPGIPCPIYTDDAGYVTEYFDRYGDINPLIHKFNRLKYSK